MEIQFKEIHDAFFLHWKLNNFHETYFISQRFLYSHYPPRNFLCILENLEIKIYPELFHPWLVSVRTKIMKNYQKLKIHEKDISKSGMRKDRITKCYLRQSVASINFAFSELVRKPLAMLLTYLWEHTLRSRFLE